MPWTAAEIRDKTPAANLFRKPVEEVPVERLLRELVGQVLGIGLGRGVVAFADVHRAILPMTH